MTIVNSISLMELNDSLNDVYGFGIGIEIPSPFPINPDADTFSNIQYSWDTGNGGWPIGGGGGQPSSH